MGGGHISWSAVGGVDTDHQSTLGDFKGLTGLQHLVLHHTTGWFAMFKGVGNLQHSLSSQAWGVACTQRYLVAAADPAFDDATPW